METSCGQEAGLEALECAPAARPQLVVSSERGVRGRVPYSNAGLRPGAELSVVSPGARAG